MQQQINYNIEKIKNQLSDLENYFLDILKTKNPEAYKKFSEEIAAEQY